MSPRSWPLLALLLSPLASGQSSTAPDTFNTLFGSTCMAHLYSLEGLTAWMAERQLAPLEEGAAQTFLKGKPGRAWAITLDGDPYAVARTDDGVCAVYARQMQGDQLQTRFATLVGKAPAPMQARSLPTAAPNRDALRSASYVWTWPDDAGAGLMFTLTTSSDPDAPLQAMASLARVDLGTASAAPPAR